LGRYLGPTLSRIKAAQNKFKEATPWLDPVENLANKAMLADDNLPSSRVAQGGAILAQHGARALNIDPRLAIIPGLMIGGVHTSGPKVGTYKWRPTGDLKPYAESIEERIEAAHHHYKKHGTLSRGGFNRDILDANGNVVARATNQGNVVFESRTGISPRAVVSKPTSAPKSNVSTTVTKAVESYGVPKPVAKQIIQRAESTDLAALRQQLIDEGLPDPELRFTRELKTTPTESRADIDARVRNPKLPRDLAPTETTPPSALGELARDTRPKTKSPTSGQLTIGPYEKGTAKAGESFANNHLSVYEDGTISKPFKVVETQAHHDKSPLKDSGDFTRGLPKEYVERFQNETAQQSIYSGDTQLNTRYIRQTYHQGNNAWKEAKSSAVHPNLQKRYLEAPSSEDRWEFIAGLTPEKRFKYLPFFIADAKEGELLGMIASFAENQLQKGNDALNNPFGGNVVQQVLAPQSKEALKIIAEKRRRARNLLKSKQP
jgi:hypothetical protein